MIESIDHALPHGITLRCRVSGPPGRPVLLFLHGFPEGAFIWDGLLAHFARPENGGYRCVAPDMRGFGASSAPSEVQAYRAKHLVQDIAALIDAESGPAPLAALVAHDWGGAVAWNVANQLPQRLQRLLIANAPHPGTFLRELQHNPQQQSASQYMHFLCRPDAEALLAHNGYERLFGFFGNDQGLAPAWLTPDLRAQYRAHWEHGLQGACHYYRASPLRPPRGDDQGVMAITLPPSMLEVQVPTRVLWGLDDVALHPGLLEGLQDWVPQLQLVPVAGASHWIVHEQPLRVQQELTTLLQQN